MGANVIGGNVILIDGMESRNGIHTIVHAEELGLGSQEYELVDMDKENISSTN